jgi:flagellar assembly factor FliW
MILEKRSNDAALDLALSPAADNTGWTLTAPESGLERGLVRASTARFGTIEVEADLIITLVEGMIGFENCKRFVVVRHDGKSAFRWLQSLDVPTVAFPIVEPAEFRPDYAPTISDSDAALLNLTVETPLLVFVVVTIPSGNPRGMTANLLAPVVINGETRQGKQVIVQEDIYTTRHLIVDEMLRVSQGVTCAPVVTPLPTTDSLKPARTVKTARAA